MAHEKQSAVIRMDIALKLLQKYHEQRVHETGTQIKYDIGELRQKPTEISTSCKNARKKTI